MNCFTGFSKDWPPLCSLKRKQCTQWGGSNGNAALLFCVQWIILSDWKLQRKSKLFYRQKYCLFSKADNNCLRIMHCASPEKSKEGEVAFENIPRWLCSSFIQTPFDLPKRQLVLMTILAPNWTYFPDLLKIARLVFKVWQTLLIAYQNRISLMTCES